MTATANRRRLDSARAAATSYHDEREVWAKLLTSGIDIAYGQARGLGWRCPPPKGGWRVVAACQL